MLDPKNFPLLESFEIEIEETWTEGDTFVSPKIRKITDLSEVKPVQASFSDLRYPTLTEVDLTELFLRSYRDPDRKPKTVFKSYEDPDKGHITRKITCEIKFKAEVKKTAQGNP